MSRQFLVAGMLAAVLGSGLCAQGGIKADLAPPGGRGSGAPERAYGGGGPADLGVMLARAKVALGRSRRCKEAGDLECAARELKGILEMPFPDEDGSRRFLGPVACNHVILLKSQGKWGDAERATTDALALLERPGVPVTYHVMLLYSLRGEVLEHLGKPKEAAQATRRAEQLELELETGR